MQTFTPPPPTPFQNKMKTKIKRKQIPKRNFFFNKNTHKSGRRKVLMKLNKYLFNTVNNKEHERSQRSVVWLKHGQPFLHHLHVLSPVFFWRPFSSFSLWIILLPPSLPPPPPRPFILPLLNQCDRYLVPLAWGSWPEGLTVAKVEAPGHSGHPPPLTTQLLNTLGRATVSVVNSNKTANMLYTEEGGLPRG